MHSHSFMLAFLPFCLFAPVIAFPYVSGNAQSMRSGNDGPDRYSGHHVANIITRDCYNSPFSRQCWGDGFSIASNMDTTWPTTGQTVNYYLEVQNMTLSPDGHPKQMLVVNGQYPGPTIHADWGDTIQITVKNSLQNNGTSMHWHGIRQFMTNPMDGTNGITECPLAPGESRTYTFLATQYGTSWYHSHYSSQYPEGVIGAIVIKGPSSADWDYDLGAMPITDWFYSSAFTTLSLLSVAAVRGPPPGDNILINGSNINTAGGGAYHQNVITKGNKHLLRFINTATQDGFQVGLDNHTFTVVAMDFVPIEPWTTTWLYIGIGQRYDVVIEANQPIASYWMHVVPANGCSSNKVANAVSIFTYEGATITTPPASMRNNTPPTNNCLDPSDNLIPYVPVNVPSDQIIPKSSNLDANFTVVQGIVQWTLDFTAIRASWEQPTLEYVRQGNTSYPQSMNLIELDSANTWSFWVLQSLANAATPQPHPVHLHGHNFYVLGAGTGVYNDSQTLNYQNPPRRDVAMLPTSGYLVLAFVADNPGAWLLHCHVAWHVDLGFAVQFLEQKDKILPLLDQTAGWNQECSSWDSYEAGALYKEVGSGL